MKWSKASRITAIVCGTLFAVSVLVTSVWSGSQIDATKIFEILMSGFGGILIGLGIATKSKLPLVFLVSILLTGPMSCNLAGLKNRSLDPCAVQKSIVSALDVGVKSLDVVPGADTEDWQNAKKYANGVVALGYAATRGCELSREDASWQAYVGLAIEVTAAMVAQFTGHADQTLPPYPPRELSRALKLLSAESDHMMIEQVR